KIVIVIDGIDHTSREELRRIQTPFYTRLPVSTALPAKIVFIIGGQHFSGIQWYNNGTGDWHQIEIDSFNLTQTTSYIHNYFSSQEDINPVVVEKLYDRTRGNPLYLKLISKQYANIDELERSVLSEDFNRFLTYENNWNDLYERYWQSFSLSERHVRVAGLISRIQEPINTKWLYFWPERDEISEFLGNFDFFFRKYDHIWIFEHDSFRAYLNQKSVTFLGSIDRDREDLFYSELAERCKNSNIMTQSWSIISYLQISKQLEESVYSRDLFLSQLISGRPVFDILEDLRILLTYYLNLSEIEQVFELLFLKLEFEIRCNTFDPKYGTEYCHYMLRSVGLTDSDLISNFSIVLYSKNVPDLYKLSFLYFNQDILGSIPVIDRIAKDFFKKYMANLLEFPSMSGLPEKVVNQWFSVAMVLGGISNSVIEEFLRISYLKNEVPDKFIPQAYEKYLKSIEQIGSLLVRRGLYDILVLLYQELSNLVQMDGWEICSSPAETYIKNKYEERIHSTFTTPFEVLLSLKCIESMSKQYDLIKPLLADNEPLTALFSNSMYSIYYKLIFNPQSMNKQDIISLLPEIPFLTNPYNENVLHRLRLYSRLHNLVKTSTDQEISTINMLDSIREKHTANLVHRKYTKDSYEYVWEKTMYSIARSYGTDNLDSNNNPNYDDLKTNIMVVLDKLANERYYEDENGRPKLSSVPFLEIIKNIFQFLSPRSAMQEWFVQKIKEKIESEEYRYSDIYSQIEMATYFYERSDVNLGPFIKLIITNSKNADLVDLWTVNETVLKILMLLEPFKRDNGDFYQQMVEYYLNYFRITNFHIQPRKDYQLGVLLVLLESLINYFDRDDQVFLEDIEYVAQILGYTREKTEHNNIDYNIWKFCEIIKRWKPVLGEQLKKQFNPYNSGEVVNREITSESFVLSEEEFNNLKDSIKQSGQIINSVYSFFKQKKRLLEYQVEKQAYMTVFQMLFDQEEESRWLENLRIFLEQYQFPKESYSSTFIESLLDFSIEKVNIPDTLALPIIKARLYPPGHHFFFDSDFEDIHKRFPKECFELGWKALNQYVTDPRNLIWSITYSNPIIYTFLPKINRENYRIFWEFYMNYLKKLFLIFTGNDSSGNQLISAKFSRV
ncbi:MAG: hypothetical protein ACFFD4_36580, partial [Candidatus Odinarchaeota archaeon]